MYRGTRNANNNTKDPKQVFVMHDNAWYDVADFLKTHPGGTELILVNQNKDVTDTMQSRVPHKHSVAAYELLAKYRVDINRQLCDVKVRNRVIAEATLQEV